MRPVRRLPPAEPQVLGRERWQTVLFMDVPASNLRISRKNLTGSLRSERKHGSWRKQAWRLKNSFQGISATKLVRKLLNLSSA